MSAGDPLTASAVQREPTISRGDIVELLAGAGAVLLRVSARAESNGDPGDVIPCRNLQSEARVTARVIDSKTVEAIRR